jgi:hypothetical protein
MSTAKAAVDIQVHLPTITYLTTPIMVFFILQELLVLTLKNMVQCLNYDPHGILYAYTFGRAEPLALL